MSTLNPSETKTYTVDLTVNGVEDLAANDLVCLNLEDIAEQNVRIKVKATRPDLTNLDSNKDKLTASVDLGRFSGYYNENLDSNLVVSVIPNLSLYSNAYEIVGYSPSSLSVNIDRLVEFDVPTNVIVQNEPGGNYVHAEPVAAVSAVTVKGPESLKDTIAYAGLLIDLSEVTDDSVANVEPVLFDTGGNVVSDEMFSVYEEYVQVSTAVLMQGEIRVELSEYTGVAETGYSVTDVIYSPEIIRVLGKEESLTFDPIILPSISIGGADENVVRTFDIQPLLAERGLMAASDEYLNVTVEIVIEKEDPTVVVVEGVDMVVVGLGEGFRLAEDIEDVKLELYGNKDTINSSDIGAYIDLTDLEEGTHRVKVVPFLPSGVNTVEDVYIYVEIASDEATTDEAEQAEEARGETAEGEAEPSEEETTDEAAEVFAEDEEEEAEE
ncbi:MAG: hypothetical protein LUD81_10995 [Clostridiales bacterium]|nr:hypothetical protein [Clostridiales bacterium]